MSFWPLHCHAESSALSGDRPGSLQRKREEAEMIIRTWSISLDELSLKVFYLVDRLCSRLHSTSSLHFAPMWALATGVAKPGLGRDAPSLPVAGHQTNQIPTRPPETTEYRGIRLDCLPGPELTVLLILSMNLLIHFRNWNVFCLLVFSSGPRPRASQQARESPP
jgi:hypothetical protein